MKNKIWIIPAFALVISTTLLTAPLVHAEGELATETPAIMPIEEGRYYLFVATGCPHCANVEKYMEINEIEANFDITITDIAVETDKQADLLALCRERVDVSVADQQCGGVPEMIYGQRIYIGEDEIMNYFRDLGYNKEPIDWGKWVVIGLLGGSALVVGGLIAYPLITKK